MTVKKIHVMTLPPDLDLALLGGLLGGVEATLFRLGAHQGWVDPDQRPALAIMAEMPDSSCAAAWPGSDGRQPMLKIVGLFEVFRDGGEYHWILRDWDGEVLARNGGYITRAGAVQDIERLRVAAVTANVVET